MIHAKNNCSFDLTQLMCSNLNYFCHRLSILNSNDSYAKKEEFPLCFGSRREALILGSSCALCHVWSAPESEIGNTLVWVVVETPQTEEGAFPLRPQSQSSDIPSDTTPSLQFPFPRLRNHRDKMWLFSLEEMGWFHRHTCCSPTQFFGSWHCPNDQQPSPTLWVTLGRAAQLNLCIPRVAVWRHPNGKAALNQILAAPSKRLSKDLVQKNKEI